MESQFHANTCGNLSLAACHLTRNKPEQYKNTLFIKPVMHGEIKCVRAEIHMCGVVLVADTNEF